MATGAVGLSWPDVLGALVAGQDLDASATAWATEQILAGSATSAQLAGFAVALRAKGETQAEVQGIVDAMYAAAKPLPVRERVVDVVGTGGDRAQTVNISTMSAIVVAGAGVPVVKHGNRAASSASGSADVLEELGVRLDVPADRVLEVYERVGITFCFAPVFHAGLRHAGPTRRELGIGTTFNFLGPLTNPAKPSAMAVGTADARMAPLMGSVLAARGADALVFRGDDGLDEITTTTTTSVWSASGADGSVVHATLDPRDLGIALGTAEDLRGGPPPVNAEVVRRLVAGDAGPVRDAVLLNAGAAIAAHAAESGDLVERVAAGMERAAASIDTGAAASLLDRWAATTQEIVRS